MTDQELVLNTVRQMPKDAALPDILDELALLASVKEGLAQSERGEGTPHPKVKKLVEQWITKSSGRRAA
jgi:predicted transcriptional regulator